MNALITYIRHVREELSHVTWPTPRQAVAHTLMVILVAAIVAVLVGALDYVFSGIVSRFVSA